MDAALANIEAQFQAAHLLERVFRQRLEQVQTVDIDEQEFVLEGEIFLQVAIATEGVQRIRDQRLFFGKTHRLHTVAGHLEGHRRAVDAVDGLAGAVQRDQLDAFQIAQQAQVEHLADVALTGEVQTQTAQLQLTEVTVSAHLQTQAQQRTVALHRVSQRGQIQRQDFGRVAGAETATHVIDRHALNRRVTLDHQRRTRTLQRVELQNAERRQRPHVVGPQQVHQRMAELRQLVVELLAQATGQERKAFQQPLHVRIPPGLTRGKAPTPGYARRIDDLTGEVR